MGITRAFRALEKFCAISSQKQRSKLMKDKSEDANIDSSRSIRQVPISQTVTLGSNTYKSTRANQLQRHVDTNDFLYTHLSRFDKQEIHLFPTFPVFLEGESSEYRRLSLSRIFLYLTFARREVSNLGVFQVEERVEDRISFGHHIRIAPAVSQDNTKITGYVSPAGCKKPRIYFILSIFAGRSHSGQIVCISGVYRRKMQECDQFMTWRFALPPIL